MEHPVGTYDVPGNPIHLSASDVDVTRAPLLGEHNEEVYRELGIDEERLEELKGEGVV